MNKSTELINMTKIVKKILIELPDTRNSDSFLYVKVVETLNPNALKLPFWEVMCSLKDLCLPNFETIRRTRQKLQNIYPELSGSDDVEAYRMVNEEAFKNYARGFTK